jgi:hypothetical protein
LHCISTPNIFDDQVAKYVMGDDLWDEISPDTDDDLDESSYYLYQLRKLWAYPRVQ